MPRHDRIAYTLWIAAFVLLLGQRQVQAQSFGIELHNTLMPASGGMAGTSIAQPQDLTSAIFGNPATLTQFPGTQFQFGGGWIEPTFNLRHSGGALPNLGTFSAKSQAQGSALGNIGVTQDFSVLGLPATFGLGFGASAAAGVDVSQVAASNHTSVTATFLGIVAASGVRLTDRLSAGASIKLGTGTFDGIFVGSSRAAYDYALRGTVGLDYELGPDTRLGFYYESKQSFRFDNAVILDLGGGAFSPSVDINIDLPDNLGLGISNESLMDGNLLVAVDVLYKQWENADLLRALYQNQWVVQAGTQYTRGRVKLRLGYAYAENPISPNPGNSAGGVAPPGAQAALEYAQALLGVINKHRISGGVGIQDILPGVDVDLFAGGMFEDSQQYGAFTSNSLESYWIGMGTTWRFGRGACRRLPIPENWGCTCGHCAACR